MLTSFLRTLVLLTTLVVSQFAHATDSPSSACHIQQASVQLDTGTLFYQSVGVAQPDRPSIVLLHGLFASKEHWDAMQCQLAMGGWHVLAPDLPGYGQSTGFAAVSYRLQAQRDHLADWLHAIQVSQVHIAGNSMGGTIAELYARKFAQQVKSVAMIGAPLGVVGWSADVREVLARGDNPFIPQSIAAFEEELALLLTRPPALPRGYSARQVAQYQASLGHYQSVWKTVNSYRHALCQTSHRATEPRNAALQIPLLVIWGSQDRIFGDSPTNRLAQCLPGSQLVRLAGEGHLPQLEAAAQVTRIYEAFLQQTQSALATPLSNAH